MRDRSADLRLLARRGFAAAAVLIVALAGYLAPRTTASSDPVQPAGFTTTATVSAAQTNVPNPGPLTGLSNATTITVNMQAAPGSAAAGNFFGAEARLCKGGVSISLQSQFNPTQGGNCLPPAGDPVISADTYGATNDRDVIVLSDPTHNSGTLSFNVGTGSVTFQANSVSTVTCDASNPCGLWIKEQFTNALVNGGFQWVHFDLQFGTGSTVPSTTVTTTVGATTTTSTATTTTLPSTSTTSSTTIPTPTSTTNSTTVTSTTASTTVPTTATTVAGGTFDPTTSPSAGGLSGVTGAPTTHLLWSALGILIAGALLVLVGNRYRRWGRR